MRNMEIAKFREECGATRTPQYTALVEIQRSIKKLNLGIGEMAQLRLGALTALPENLGLIPSTLLVAGGCL